MENIKRFFKELIPYVIIIVIVVFVRTYIVTPVKVDGNSMDPTLDNNQVLLLNKFDDSYERFDVVVFNHSTGKLVKRIIGLPGDNIYYKNNQLYINNNVTDEPFDRKTTKDFNLTDIGYDTIPEGKYFVLGDNRIDSLDSRYIGLIDKEDIEGVVKLSLFPLKKVK